MVVSDIFYVHPYLGKIPILTDIFQMGWNHQPENRASFNAYNVIPKLALLHLPVASGYQDGTVRLWDLKDWAFFKKLFSLNPELEDILVVVLVVVVVVDGNSLIFVHP